MDEQIKQDVSLDEQLKDTHVIDDIAAFTRQRIAAELAESTKQIAGLLATSTAQIAVRLAETRDEAVAALEHQLNGLELLRIEQFTRQMRWNQAIVCLNLIVLLVVLSVFYSH